MASGADVFVKIVSQLFDAPFEARVSGQVVQHMQPDACEQVVRFPNDVVEDHDLRLELWSTAGVCLGRARVQVASIPLVEGPGMAGAQRPLSVELLHRGRTAAWFGARAVRWIPVRAHPVIPMVEDSSAENPFVDADDGPERGAETPAVFEDPFADLVS